MCVSAREIGLGFDGSSKLMRFAYQFFALVLLLHSIELNPEGYLHQSVPVKVCFVKAAVGRMVLLGSELCSLVFARYCDVRTVGNLSFARASVATGSEVRMVVDLQMMLLACYQLSCIKAIRLVKLQDPHHQLIWEDTIRYFSL